MILKFIDDNWNGIESGIVKFANENDDIIFAHYNDIDIDYYNNLWESHVDNELLWESKGANNSLDIDGIHYDNLWCYIVLNEIPVFYDEDNNKIELDNYTIEF